MDVTRVGREPLLDLIEDITASVREVATVDFGQHEVDSGRLLASVSVHVHVRCGWSPDPRASLWAARVVQGS